MATILLPIETISRELDYKLMLACLLADNTKHDIYIGEFHFLDRLLPHFKNGIYLGKTLITRMLEFDTGTRLRQYKDAGFNILYLNEEGLGFIGPKEKWGQVFERQYHPELFDENDVLCEWSNFQAEFDKQRVGKSKVLIEETGHPKFDLYKNKYRFFYQEQTNEIRNRIGNYILISGRYSIANHVLGVKHTFSKAANYVVEDEEKRMRHVGWFTEASLYKHYMIELVHALSLNFPTEQFVFRPHPSENFEYYEQLFKGVKNVKVFHEGAIGPWLFAAKALIHDGCTTGIESTLASIPTIVYKPFINPKYELVLQNQMGWLCTSTRDVVSAIGDVLEGKPLDHQVNPLALQLLHNFTDDSYDNIVSLINTKIRAQSGAQYNVPDRKDINKKYLTREVKILASKTLNILPKRAHNKRKLKMAFQKFPGFNLSELKRKLYLVEKELEKDISLEYYNKYLIRIF